MTEAEARTYVASLAFVLVTAIAALAWGQIALNYLFGIWLLYLTFTGVDRHDLRLQRRRTMHALGTLRRRHDNELMEVWCAAKGKPAAEYVPDEASAPAAMEQSDILTEEDVRKTDPITEPIVMPAPVGPSTVPAAVVIDAEWQAKSEQLMAEAREAFDRIGAEE